MQIVHELMLQEADRVKTQNTLPSQNSVDNTNANAPVMIEDPLKEAKKTLFKDSQLIQDSDKDIISQIMIGVLKILVDAIINELSTQFVEDLKRRLTYEISMAITLKSESGLRLSFDVRNYIERYY
jgi:hypothetical protein